VTGTVVLVPTNPRAVEVFTRPLTRLQIFELTHDGLDMVIVGQIMAGTFSSKTALNKDQQKSYTHLYHEGV